MYQDQFKTCISLEINTKDWRFWFIKIKAHIALDWTNPVYKNPQCACEISLKHLRFRWGQIAQYLSNLDQW